MPQCLVCKKVCRFFLKAQTSPERASISEQCDDIKWRVRRGKLLTHMSLLQKWSLAALDVTGPLMSRWFGACGV